MKIGFYLNGKKTVLETAPDRRVVDLLREDCGLTGVKECCGSGECGACTILVDGESRLSCLMLAAQLEDRIIVTIEGLVAEEPAPGRTVAEGQDNGKPGTGEPVTGAPAREEHVTGGLAAVEPAAETVAEGPARERPANEGLTPGKSLHAVQRAFIEHGAVQCGYCTPGMVLAAVDLLRRRPAPTREEIRAGISGNICRCTGYQKIIDAIYAAAPGRPEGDK